MSGGCVRLGLVGFEWAVYNKVQSGSIRVG